MVSYGRNIFLYVEGFSALFFGSRTWLASQRIFDFNERRRKEKVRRVQS